MSKKSKTPTKLDGSAILSAGISGIVLAGILYWLIRALETDKLVHLNAPISAKGAFCIITGILIIPFIYSALRKPR